MAERVEKVTKVQDPDTTREVVEVQEASVSGATMAVRIIWFIAGLILVLLAFRFVLALLGANPNNAFAAFIYDVSRPFVAPFFTLFNYDLQEGRSRFELYTLVAMLVYTVIAWGLSKLVTLGKPRPA